MARVLIVDDDADVRALIELALEGQGHDIDSVESGRAALERLAQHAYDLIVCDLHMPDRDGPAVYRAIERRPPPRPAFLFVTGYADGGPYEEFIRAMQPTLVSTPFHREGWVYEEKYDGWRMVAYKREDGVQLISRSGRDHTSRFPELVAAIASRNE